jgi:hypothetical protein
MCDPFKDISSLCIGNTRGFALKKHFTHHWLIIFMTLFLLKDRKFLLLIFLSLE